MNTKNILRSSAKWFLLVTVIGVILVSIVFGAICRPKDFETVNVFITSKSCDNIKMTELLEQTTSCQVSVAQYSFTNSNYYNVLSTSGMLLSDIIIIPQSIVPDKNLDKEFAPLTSDLLKKYGINDNDMEFINYANDSLPYALKVWDNETKTNRLEPLVNFDDVQENYYLLVNITRPNAAPYSTAKNTSTNAFVALATLLNYKAEN